MPSKKQKTLCAAKCVFTVFFSVFAFCTGIPLTFAMLRGLFQGLLPWRADARGHESNSVSLSFCLLLYSLFFGQTLILQVFESLVPFQHSTQYVFNFRHISNPIDVHRDTHMLKVRRVLECLYWIRDYGIEVSGKCPGRLLLKKPDKPLFCCEPVMVQ